MSPGFGEFVKANDTAASWSWPTTPRSTGGAKMVWEYMDNFVKYGKAKVPEELWATTPFVVLAGDGVPTSPSLAPNHLQPPKRHGIIFKHCHS